MDSLLESFDYCRVKFNTFDLRHLACTKVINKICVVKMFFIYYIQVFLCHDRTYEYKDVAEILSHELVHAFDYCRANIDIENNRHVACSEVGHRITLKHYFLSIFFEHLIYVNSYKKKDSSS